MKPRCCGALMMHSGVEEPAKELARATIAAFVGVAITAAVLFVAWVTGIVWAVKQERLARVVAADHEPELASA